MNFLKKITKIFYRENPDTSNDQTLSDQVFTPNTNKDYKSECADNNSPIEYGVVVKFKFKGLEYTLEEFELNFDQPINARGKLDGRPRGGIMTLVFSDTLSNEINDWIQKEGVTQNGEIIFYSYKSKIDEGALLNIAFSEAYCIYYKKSINIKNGLITTLVISPRSIKVGNNEFENIWKTSKELPYTIKSN